MPQSRPFAAAMPGSASGDATESSPGRAAPAPSQSPPSSPLPSLSLPKGGGAIRGIGEKFAANPVTGTGSMTVPIAVSPGRSGFGPQLSLSYDSGAGNGPFGFGWSLSLPAITRKTDKGLPQYRDAEESDVYRPLRRRRTWCRFLRPDGTRFEDDTSPRRATSSTATARASRACSRASSAGRNAPPARSTGARSPATTSPRCTARTAPHRRSPDPADPTRIFSWLICESYDDKGNAIVYEYAAENDDERRPRRRPTSATACARPTATSSASSTATASTRLHGAGPGACGGWMFEVVFDYDEGHYEEVDLDPSPAEAAAAPVRAGASASPDDLGGPARPVLLPPRRLRGAHVPPLPPRPDVPSLPDLRRARTATMAWCGPPSSTTPTSTTRSPSRSTTSSRHQGSTRFASFIRSVTQSGYVRDDSQAGRRARRRRVRHLPQEVAAAARVRVQQGGHPGRGPRASTPRASRTCPSGLDGAAYQWVDLDGEGVSGILTEQAGAWFYKPNLGGAAGSAPLETRRRRSRRWPP